MAVTQKIQRYVLRECVAAFSVTLSVILLAILLVDVVEQMRTIGDNVEISIFQAGQLTLMKMPMLIEQTMPFMVLIAAIMAFNRLSRRSELPAMRAAGISAWRFLAPLALFALVLGLLNMMVINPLGARLTANFEDIRADLLSQDVSVTNIARSGLWLRQGDEAGQIVIHAQTVSPTGTEFYDLRLFEYERVYSIGRQTEEFAFRRRIEADAAILRDGFWQLQTVVEYTADQPPVEQEFLSSPTTLNANQLLDRFASPNTVGFWELPDFVEKTQNAGLDVSRYAMRYEALRASPVLMIAMALIGALVCLRLSRLGGTSILIGWGATAAIVLYFITRLAGSLGSAGAVPAVIAAWAPPLFALFVALTAIAYLEDG